MTASKSWIGSMPPAIASNGVQNPATCQKYQRDVPNVMKAQKPTKTLMQARNDQRSWGNAVIRVRAARPAKTVPASRSMPLFSDSPTVDREQNATEKPAQCGLSQFM